MSIPADPIERFHAWFAEAQKSEPNDPSAVALATANAAGLPSVRMVLLKGADSRGFVFYTNLESRKGREVVENPHASLCFHWKSLRRQIRVDGTVAPVGAAEADAYYASRPRASRIGAWASKQSHPLGGMFELERRVAEYTAKFGLGDIPRPDFWSGFRVVPSAIEFWEDKPFRLHERIRYQASGESWKAEHLYP